jgi:TRAP-type mannitol/chloroaromatic compound transport system permease small subunit
MDRSASPAGFRVSAIQSIGLGLVRTGRALAAAGAWPGRYVGWLLVPLTVLVIASVVGSLLRLSDIVRWGVDLPVLGTGLNLNGLTELQWHLLAVITMLALPYALVENRHIRVDILYETLSPRSKAAIDLIGDLILLLPFCIVIGYLSINFVAFAYKTGEQSTYGGLVDRWVVKSFLPLGLGLLALTAVGRILAGIGTLLSSRSEVTHD